MYCMNKETKQDLEEEFHRGKLQTMIHFCTSVILTCVGFKACLEFLESNISYLDS